MQHKQSAICQLTTVNWLSSAIGQLVLWCEAQDLFGMLKCVCLMKWEINETETAARQQLSAFEVNVWCVDRA